METFNIYNTIECVGWFISHHYSHAIPPWKSPPKTLNMLLPFFRDPCHNITKPTIPKLLRLDINSKFTKDHGIYQQTIESIFNLGRSNPYCKLNSPMHNNFRV